MDHGMMKSMVITAKEKKEDSVTSVVDKPDYPYGLRINLEPEMAARVGLGMETKVGSKMMMMAIVEVTSINKEASEDAGEGFSVGLQITDMEVKAKKEEVDHSKVLFGDMA